MSDTSDEAVASDDVTVQVVLPVEAPERPYLDPDDPMTDLRLGVEAALLALSSHFDFPNAFGGIAATDLFALNTLLGAGIEVEVVRTLNGLRELWDPDKRWSDYTFERSSQSFPDVRLTTRRSGTADTILGIELKGWYLFAKEGVPSLRYKVAPAACAPHDLVCVVPWYLSNAVSGVPEVTTPWVESARYAAEYRDHWWQHIRRTTSDASVTYPPDATPYPAKADLVSAVPASDGGDNYGRLPRAKPLMDEFITSSMAFEVLGIPASSWVTFLKTHSDRAEPEEIVRQLEARLRTRGVKGEGQAQDVATAVLQIAKAFGVTDE
ncbi:hypothetical protein ACFWGN_17715 [Oerskovia sp. NPDC060338]|uniref:hypothetical protein n=1 Tax=Oerskovia sp. NPDC060338 TaxID=3347100 RepID=UPI00365C2C60